MDIHWRPYHLGCNVCHTNFTVISKMETFEEDKQKIGELTKWDMLASPRHKNKLRNASNINIRKEYAAIPKATIDVIVDLYKYDFEMFEYEVEPNFN